MGISTSGLVSGIDSASLIDQLVSIEKQKVTKVQNDKAADQVKIDAYSKVRSLLTDLKTKITDLSKSSSFDVFKSTSSNESAVTVSGGAGAIDGQYDVQVFQLASNEKMISKDGKVTSQSAALSTMGISTGTINVDGVDITVSDTDTIQDLRSKINSATKTNGDKLNVSASVLKISDNNFRLVLSSKNTGSTGIAYSGDTLKDLGIIDATGSKGNIKQTLTSSSAFDFDSIAQGTTIQFSGKDHNGNTVSSMFIKTADSTENDFLKKVEATFNGTVNASIDESTGKLVIQDKTDGTSRLSLDSFTTSTPSSDGVAPATTNSYSFAISDIGKEGAGVLSTGKDSYYSVENINMSNSSNSVSGAVTGVTFNFKGVTANNTVNVTLERDSDAIQKKVQDLIDSYNKLLEYSNTATKFKDPNTENSQDGELAGDSTLPSMVSSIRSIIKGDYSLFGNSGKYTTLTMFGIKTDTTTGELSIDKDMFSKGLTTHLNDMINIFTTMGVSDNNSVSLGRNTVDTKSGKYTIEEVDPNHLRIQIAGSTDWYTSDARTGDIVTFSDGPAKGLTITSPAGTIGPTGTTFTFQKGISTLLTESIDRQIDANDGTIAMRQQSWQKSMKDKDDRITRMNTQIDDYKQRLTKQFTAMEQAMSDMQSQASKLVSALGKSS